MSSIHRTAIAGLLAAGLLFPVGLVVGDDSAAKDKDSVAKEAAAKDSAAKDSVQDAKKIPAAKPKRVLSQEQIALRDRVRQVLAMRDKLSFNTQQNSPTEIMGVCLAFGCGSEVSLGGPGEQHINGITCLCWNYQCRGNELLAWVQGRIAARIGYGYQEHPGEFLATLALSRVPADYPIRVGKTTRTVADLVASEKFGCRSGGDQSFKLIGLSYYVDEPQWTNELGETWSIERIVGNEIVGPVVTTSESGINRLMGLSYAVARRMKRGGTIEGQYARAQTYAAAYQTFALQMQNADGSWGPHFLAARSASQEPAEQLRSTGRILEWLAMSLPENRLEDAGVANAVECVTGLLGGERYQWNNPSLSTREIVSLGHALHALDTYDERVFKPADVEEKPAAEKPSSANREAKTVR